MKRNTIQRLIFLLALVLGITTARGQILNGSFEEGLDPDLSHWEWTCGAISLNNAPAGGGNWCIQVDGGNTQGCFPGYAYQRLPAITNGQTFMLSGWAYAQMSTAVGIYFGKISNGVITLQAGDTTNSTSWAQLSVQSSFALSTGDTAVVVLDAGLIGGPIQIYGHFDLIGLQPMTGIHSPGQKQSSKFYPNPCNDQTTMQAGHPLRGATLTVCNALGQTVKQVEGIHGQTVVLSREHLESGLYFVWLTQDSNVISVDKLVITD